MAPKPTMGTIIIDPTIKTVEFDQALAKMEEKAGKVLSGMSDKMKFFVDAIRETQESMESISLMVDRTNADGQWELTQAISTLKMEIGATVTQMSVVFLPAATVMESTLTQLAALARQAAQCIALVFGKQLIVGYGSLAKGADGAADAQKKLGKATRSAAKVAKDALAPFDDLHVLQKDIARSGGSGGGGSVGLVDEEGFASLADYLTLSPMMLAFLEKLREMMEPLSKISLENLGLAFENLKEAIGEDLQSSLTNFEWLWYNVLVPMAKWTVEDALPAFLNAVAGGLRVMTAVVEIFREAGIWLYDHFLIPIAKWTGGVVVEVLKLLGSVLEGLARFFRENKDAFVEGIKMLTSLAMGFGVVMLAQEAWGGAAAGMATAGIKIAKALKSVKSLFETIALSMMMHPYIALFTAIAGAIIYFATKVNEAHEKARTEELGKRFGKMTLSLQELEKECKRVQTPFTQAMEGVLRQSEKAQEAAENVGSLQQALGMGVAKLSLTLESKGISEESKADAKEQALHEVEEFIQGVNDSLTDQKLLAKMSFEAMLSDNPEALRQVMQDLDAFLTPVMEEAAALSQQLRDQMVDALQDGVLDDAEQKAILQTSKRLNEIQQQIASHEAYVQMEKVRIQYKAEDGRLSLEGFNELQGALQDKLAKDFENADAMHIETLAWLDMVYQNDPEKMAEMKQEAEAEFYKQKINISWEVQTAELRNFNEMLAGYGPEIGAAKSMDAMPKLGDYLEAATKYVMENAAALGVEKSDQEAVAAHINAQMQQMYKDAMEGITLDDTETGVAKELLGAMEPNVQSWLALKEAYKAQGKEIPSEVAKALEDYDALQGIVTASEGMVDYAGAGVETAVRTLAQEIALNGGVIPDSLQAGMEAKKEQINQAAHDFAQHALEGMKPEEAQKLSLTDVIGEFKATAEEKEKARQSAAQYAGDIGDAAAKAAEEKKAAYKQAASGGVQAYVTGLDTGKEGAIAAGGGVAQAAAGGMQAAAEDSGKGFGAQGGLADKQYAKGMADNAAATSGKAAKGVAQGAVAAANTVMNDKASGPQSAGKNFDAGVAKGVADNATTVYDAVKKLAKGMVDTLNESLKIKSPSKVGAESGGHLAEGVAQGILGGISAAVRAVSTLGGSIRAAMGEMSLVPEGLGSRMGDEIGGQMMSALKLAGAGSLPMPALASGLVMTQGARMMQAASLGGSASHGGWMADEEGLRALVREEVGEIVRGTAVHFKGPGARFARALSPELDRESQRRGVKLVTGDVGYA